MPKDSKIVAKIVLFDKENKVLFLKRSNYIKKFAGKWDLPGGHIHDLDRPIRVSNLARRFEVWRGRAARVDDERAVVALDSVCKRQRGA